MDRIENESSGLFCPGAADVFVGERPSFFDLAVFVNGIVVLGDVSPLISFSTW